MSDHSDLVGRFGKVLILTEHHGDIVPAAVCEAHDVESQPHVDTLFLPHKKDVLGPIREANGLVAVAK